MREEYWVYLETLPPSVPGPFDRHRCLVSCRLRGEDFSVGPVRPEGRVVDIGYDGSLRSLRKAPVVSAHVP